jgi:transposase
MPAKHGRDTYVAVDTSAARGAVECFYRWAGGVQVRELCRLARTVKPWEVEILAFHSTAGCSNEPTEAINMLVKKAKRFSPMRRTKRGDSWQVH